MCGINGIIGLRDKDEARSVVSAMNETMKHRGPDDDGIFANDDLGLGHRRLSIIDLSSAGHQPMFSNDQECVIVFNGEIYNYRSVKDQISDYQFKTNTDTEVILAAYQKWGLSFIKKLDGMFAIALYDLKLKKLFLIRDRLGVKPLYYSQNEAGEIIFASEIRSILSSGKIKRKLNVAQLANYLTLQTTVGIETLIEDIYMLAPGSIATISDGRIQIQPYWKISTDGNISGDSFATAKKKTRDLFLSAVEKRLMSDVPLGAFLSGGIDSSAVVAAMSACKAEINTFNVNFSEKKFSEAVYAESIAKKYKTNHTCIDLKADDFLALLPDALTALDYPSWDGINTYVVSKAVKDAGISVALSGIGGDEWFGGYPVFDLLNKISLAKLNLVPQSLRKLMANTLSKIQNDYSKEKKYELIAGKIDIENSYYAIRKLFTNKQIENLLTNPSYFDNSYHPSSSRYAEISVAEWQNYLMPVLLRDTDQMSMAHALEIREPFLDYQLIEYVLTLPDEFKKGKTTKSLFVESMGDLLPQEIVNRPKMGFVLPWQQWLKTDLRPIVNEGLEALCHHSAFNANAINYLRDNYYNNRHNIRWTMILNLTVLGYWMKKNEIE